jgi:hypothetical protein
VTSLLPSFATVELPRDESELSYNEEVVMRTLMSVQEFPRG